MKPEVLVMAASPSADVMAQLERLFVCHHLWRQPRDEQSAWLDGIAASVRGVLTTGAIGIDAALLARLPKLEIVAVNGIGTDAVDLPSARSRGIHVTNTTGFVTVDFANRA